MTDILVKLSHGTRGTGWWEEYGSAVPGWLGLFAGLESGASQIATYDPEVVHGLLQTPDYARAVIRSIKGVSEDIVEQRLLFRLERQRIVLERPNPARLSVVIGASVLNLVVGSQEIMAEEIEHLLELDSRNSVDVRVRPWEAGPHPWMRGAFAILDFDDPDDPPFVHTETHAGTHYGTRSGTERIQEYLPNPLRRRNTDQGVRFMTESRVTEWIKASASNANGTCVEMRRNGERIEVRDTKQNGGGPILSFTSAEFSAWIDGANKGEFTHLI